MTASPRHADRKSADRELTAILSPPQDFLGGIAARVLKGRGKNRRSVLVLALGRLLEADSGPTAVTAAAVEAVHLATLIHDDVLDGGLLRRNRPSLHREEGAAPAVLYGDLIFSRAVSAVNRIGKSGLTGLFLETVGSLVSGEILAHRMARDFPWNEDDWRRVARLKTAALFRYCCRAPGILAGVSRRQLEVLGRFGVDLGLYYQAADDCLDFFPRGEDRTKDSLADLKNGVVNLVLVMAGKDRELKKKLSAVLNSSSPMREREELAGRIRDGGFVLRALSRAREYLRSARREMGLISGWGAKTEAGRLIEYLDEEAEKLETLEESLS